MSQFIDAEQWIQKADPGTMVYARFQTDAATWQTGFLVREEPKYVKAFGQHPIVAMRSGLMQEGKVALVATLFRIGAGKDAQFYETWWNWHGPENRESFYDIASQERIGIFFFTPGRERAIQVSNAFRDLFMRAITSISAMPAWSMSDFNQARDGIYARYPGVQVLWNNLQ